MRVHPGVVLSNANSITSMKTIREIAGGNTDPTQLAKHRDPRCKATEEEIRAALSGHYRPEHLFVLEQSLDLYDAHQEADRGV